MRKLIVLITLLLSLSINGYSQVYPIPAQDSQWGMVTSLGPPGLQGAGNYGSIYRYKGKDTLINEQTYQYWNGAYTRYNDNKLFMIDREKSKPDSIVEVVYYDFNLAVNDSFLIPYSFSFPKFYAYVRDVSSFTTLNGQIRKMITLSIENFNFPCASEMKWIEGVGDIRNGVFYLSQLGTCDVYKWIACFSDSSGSVYKKADFSYPCDSLDTYVSLFDTTNNGITNNISLKPKMKIYPNPVFDKLIIESDVEIEKVQVVNIFGQVMLESNKKVLECSKLKRGVYLLMLSKSNNKIEVYEFMKD